MNQNLTDFHYLYLSIAIQKIFKLKIISLSAEELRTADNGNILNRNVIKKNINKILLSINIITDLLYNRIFCLNWN